MIKLFGVKNKNGRTEVKAKIIKPKIHCEELEEKAKKWFYNRFEWQITEDIFKLYMKEHNIKQKDVNW